MTGLLELRKQIKDIYSKYDTYFIPVVKFILALVALSQLNSHLGWTTRLDSLPIVIIATLVCSILPMGVTVFFCILFALLHMYGLAMEVAAVGLVVFFVLYLLLLRFGGNTLWLAVLTPILFLMKIPYVIPIVAGLMCAPTAIVSVVSGVVAYYFLEVVATGASNINTMGSSQATEKISYVLNGIVSNRTMFLVAIAFTVTILVVYLIRRLSVDYSWTIATVTGAILEVVILLMGDLVYGISVSTIGVILGALLGVVVGMILQFFRFLVDYSRTERVQFEDEEYYYYVKAIPKMSVSAPTNTVKRINKQVGGERENERTVVTEHIASTFGRRNKAASGKTVTVGSTNRSRRKQYEEQFYEEPVYEEPVYEEEYYEEEPQYEGGEYYEEPAYTEEEYYEEEPQYTEDGYEEIDLDERY